MSPWNHRNQEKRIKLCGGLKALLTVGDEDGNKGANCSMLCVVVMMTWSYQTHTYVDTKSSDVNDGFSLQLLNNFDPISNCINVALNGFFF